MRRSHHRLALAAALLLAGAGYTAPGGTATGPAAPPPGAQPAPAAPGAGAPDPAPGAGATDDATPGAASPGDTATHSLPPAPPLPAGAPDLPRPARLTVGDLGIDGAPIVAVGVEPNGDMEIPGADEVGWYRFGARPGDGGSAVLAAHVAYDGVDGVFRHLQDLRPGATVTVDLADGSSRAFVVDGVERYPKEALPDTVFSRDGAAGLVLITCGGRFDRAARSYDDNVVAYARPAPGGGDGPPP